jgi:hypothetical protein
MKSQLKHAGFGLLLLSALNSQLSTAHAQGSLTPPGAPAPTMKSLAQIEPRTPISTAPFNISTSGSYYLTTNLTVSSGLAVSIGANGVTLDLNGFTLASTEPGATSFGIVIFGSSSDVAILHGHIRGGVTNNGSGTFSGPGFGYGIYGPTAKSVQVTGVSVSGVLNYGIYLSQNDATLVESCTVRTTGSYGILANTIKSSLALDCGNTAIYGNQISDCRGECVNGFFGVNAVNAQNCSAASSSSYGLYANSAQNCYGSSTNSVGLYATSAQNCFGYSISSYGISASLAQNCYGNSVTGIGLAAQNANTCMGYRPGGTAIQATVANGCYASIGTNIITYKYNMP